jgi:hypothetical protein
MGISGLVSMEVLDDGTTYDKGKEVNLAEMKTQGAGKRQLNNTRLLLFWNIFISSRRNR